MTENNRYRNRGRKGLLDLTTLPDKLVTPSPAEPSAEETRRSGITLPKLRFLRDRRELPECIR